MAKSPAFQFYVKDWLASTKVRLMSHEQRGAYMDLMCHAWNEDDCSLNNNDDDLAILSSLHDKWPANSEKIKACFKLKGSRLVHERLLAEREKQKGFSEKCKKAGMASGKARRTKALELNERSSHVEHKTNSAVCSLQSSSASSSASSSTSLKNIKPLPSESLRLAEVLAEEIIKRDENNTQLLPAKRASSIKKWAKDIDKLNRLDKKPWDEIETVMVWSQSDNFWQNNILSGQKLREKFDTLKLKMKNNPSDPDAKTRERARIIKEATDEHEGI